MTHALRQFWHLALVVLMASLAGAQPAPVIDHETEAETVAKCVAEMASQDAATRRRAILVLGKYPTNIGALRALQQALADTDALVRRSALVSFSEQTDLPASAVKPLLDLLKDPDVHVRRIASSMLPELLLRSRLSLGGQLRPPIRPGSKPVDDDDDDPTVRLIGDALADQDATVVKNVLSAAGILLGQLPVQKITACLANEDREVRVLALQNLQRYPIREEQQMADALVPLLEDKDENVRGETAKLLARCGAAGIPSLRLLAKDKAASVRFAAARQLILFEDRSSRQLLPEILTDTTISPDERSLLVHYLLREEPPNVDLLKKLAVEGPSEVRAAALRSLSNQRLGNRTPPSSFFIQQLEDPSPEVRQASARSLLTVATEFGEVEVKKLLGSKYPDVRSMALSRARLLPAEIAREVLLDACLDDDLTVRCSALSQLALGNVPGWEDILAQSLQDPEEQVRRTAVNALGMRRTPGSLKALQEFAQTCDDPALVHQIQLILRRPVRPPVNRTQPVRPTIQPAAPKNP